MARVNWFECRAFCARVGLDLPTEAQWEHACRAKTTGPYAGTGRLDDMGWHAGNSGGEVHRVGRRLPNAFGLHDMHGNVMEWCEDDWSEDFFATPEAAGPDPVCRTGSTYRVLRGGHALVSAAHCRSANREGCDPDWSYIELGLRPALRVAGRQGR